MTGDRKDQPAGSRQGWPALGSAVSGWRTSGAGNSVAGPVAGVVIQAGTVSGGVHLEAGPRFSVPLPRQFPAGPAVLVDRTMELSVLDGVLADGETRGPLIVVISGPPGMGKTAVALWWLRAHEGEFPDGQLHADLDGSHGGGEFVADVLARWLRALGMAPEWIPAGTAELAALWRSVTTGRHLAILVENAATVAAVRMLLPGAGRTVVTVTSRRKLPAAAGDGARFVHLGPLPEQAAVGLLERIAGAGRVAAEPAAARRLVACCGGIPLAVCAAAGQLAVSAGEAIADAAAGLADRRARLDGGADKEAGMRAGLDRSYAALDPAARGAYRLLGLHPGPDFGPGLAAAVLDTPPGEARTLIGHLTAACLLETAGQGRYRFHDLIRMHARDLAEREEPEADRRAVTGRIAGWYLHNAAETERLLQPYRHGMRRDAAPPPCQDPEVTAATALDWLERERHSLRSVVRAAASDGWQTAAWQLADAMWPLFLYRGHPGEQLQVSRTGLAAARDCADPEGQARMLDRIGLAARQLGRLDEAATSFRQARVLWRRLGDTRKVIGTTRKLGFIAAARGDLDTAIRLYRTALHCYQEPGTHNPREAALALVDLGNALTAAGHADEAITALREAARLLEGEPDPYNQARAQAALGRALASRPARAEPLLLNALTVMTGLGVIPARAEILETLALIATQTGDHEAARSRYQQALAILPPGHPRVPAIRNALAELPDPEDGQ
jgi:tetratricopeptide (TPR) repeat protein